ncbi:hypothetical protein UO65_5113 [Actinokineospora spheciospongiae]|uniref:AAA+ ATPase domain-containing protein n=1 Tax=Actinokineospora spheciospongiae TaxID=909613 RepID=W7IS93_9PSEU|nr:hypothetical protein [Actinokineospora spheciospongiae]EWC59572.1 hypothetical protein UO65_5113 [Actinokineospora spheciospongiae]
MSDEQRPARRRNPFADMAVANVSLVDGDPDSAEITVLTDAMRTAFAFLDDYLDGRDDRPGGPGGTVIALLGDYGIGKTHLSVRMVSRARRRLGNPRGAMYLDAAAADFLSLYKRFMTSLGVSGLVALVNDYYADRVAEALEPSGLTKDDVRAMSGLAAETEREDVRWHEIARELGLLESRLLRQVRETLAGVTANRDFAAALTLLLRTGFQDAVWNWLLGGRPEQILVDRGVTKVIDDDLVALEALRVFALLLGGREQRFVLVVDELDKIFSAQHAPGHAEMSEFQELLQVATKAGACLVLGGLPEVWPALSGPVRARIPHPVRLAGLTEQEITDFIMRTQEATLGARTLSPFTPPVVRTIRMVTRGNPREVIRLCHRAFRLADDRRRETGVDAPIDDALLSRASTDLFGQPNADDIGDQIARVLTIANWDHYRDRVLGPKADTRADYWVRFPQRASGCAVLLTSALLTEADVDAVLARVVALRGVEPHAVILPVVTGTPTDIAVARVREHLGHEPVLYRQATFVDDLLHALETAMSRLPELDAADPVGQVLTHTEQILRRMATMHRDLLEQIQHNADRVESVLTRPADPTPTPASVPAPQADDLPEPVAGLFTAAVDALTALTTIDPEVALAFDTGTYEAADPALRIVERPDVVAAAGTGRLLVDVVARFRSAVAAWFHRYPGTTDADARAALEGVCNVYDAMAEYLPTFRLTPLTAVPGRPEDALARVEESLSNLSFRVRRQVLRTAAGR